MKKNRILALVLVLALALSLVPVGMAATIPETSTYYEKNPYTNAKLIRQEADGAYHYQITIAADRAHQSVPLFLTHVYATVTSSDTNIVDTTYGTSCNVFYGRAPGTATVTLSLRSYDGNTLERKAVIDVTVLSEEDFSAYGGDDVTRSIKGHKHTYTIVESPELKFHEMLRREVCTECGDWSNLRSDPLPSDYGSSAGEDSDTDTSTNQDTTKPETPHTHNYTSQVTKQPATSQPGVRTYTCTICGDTYTEAIPATSNAQPSASPAVGSSEPSSNLPGTAHPFMSGTVTRLSGTTPTKSNTYKSSDFRDTVRAHLYENERGGLTRVEYISGRNSVVVVEEFDSSFNLQSSLNIKPELPLWGGFYAGKDSNYLIFGQLNYDEDDSKEVIRVVKYSKNWERLDALSILGANTRSPFNAGSLRCAEYGGYLYVRTCHKMYRSSDGVVHQASMMFSLRENDMTLMDCQYQVQNNQTGYVSHSFDQYILVSQNGTTVTADMGDAYPRGIGFATYHANAGTGRFSGQGWDWCDFQVLHEIPGNIGDNATGCSIGGLVETSSGYVIPFDYDQQGGSGKTRYMYLGYIDKQRGQAQVRQLKPAEDVNTPKIVSTGLDGGYIIWLSGSTYEEPGTLQYCRYMADGTIGQIQSIADIPLSSCQPINYNGNVVWYVSKNYSEPVFYMLNSSGITSVNTAPAKEETPETSTQQPGTGKQTFSDVPAGIFFTEPVAWAVEKGVTNGTTTTTFSPYEKCTQVQILTFLWRAAGKPASNTALPINITGKNIDYAEGALRWAAENKMIDRSFVPNTPCTRASAVTYIWQAFGSPEVVVWSASDGWGGSNFTDVPANSTLADAISWAVAEEVTNGTSQTTFSPNGICNRGEIVTFLYRAYH